jgi:hypothetical protein
MCRCLVICVTVHDRRIIDNYKLYAGTTATHTQHTTVNTRTPVGVVRVPEDRRKRRR